VSAGAVERWWTTAGDRVEVYRDIEDQYRWTVRAANGEIVEQGESHPDKRDAVAAAERHHPRVGAES
jgi:uncharacterized protein YegP (UPF0339 family)